MVAIIGLKPNTPVFAPYIYNKWTIMSRNHTYRYLNNTQQDFEQDLLFSHFAKVLQQGQKRMPAGQWPNFIKALTNKGVRKTEIDDSGVLEHLSTLDPKQPVTREELIKVIHNHLFTIKEVDLSVPVYERYSQARDRHHSYQESLYILNSPRSNIEDRLLDIQWELEDLDFEPERLIENPMLAMNLYEERQALLEKKKTAYDHRISHFTDVKDPTTNEPIRNVIAHARFTVRDDVFFIEEIQSDWGQRGRARNWNGIPKAPYVGHTDTWAGLVFRRLMQRAAANPNIKQVAWIVGGMENGGRTSTPEGVNHFYRNVLPKIADKALSGTGEKTQMKDVKLRSSLEPRSLPSIDMTDRVREKFTQSQPLYSKDLLPLQHYRRNLNAEQERNLRREVNSAREMLGDTVSLNLAKQIIDYASGEEVAGKMDAVLKQITVSLNARDPSFVLNHEIYHYAHETLINPAHAEIVERAFAYPGELNDRVRIGLIRRKASEEAIRQCDDPKEAAAYGFALWKNGEIQLNKLDELDNQVAREEGRFDKTVAQVFRKVERSFIKLGQWARRVTKLDQKDNDQTVVKALFTQLRSGYYAQNENPSSRHQHFLQDRFKSTEPIYSEYSESDSPPRRSRPMMRG